MTKARKTPLVKILPLAAYSYITRKRVVASPPFRLWLEPTNICNLRCVMCPTPSIPKAELGVMDFKLYQKIIDDGAAFLNEVYLFHRGESLINPNLADMVAYGKSKNISMKLNTNATLMTAEWSKKLLEAGIDLISFSVDGYVKEVYEEIRKKARFDSVIENVKTFLRLKKAGRYKTLTQIEVLEFKSRATEDLAVSRERFFKLFDGLEFDRKIIRIPHNVGGLVEIAKEDGYNVSHDVYLPCSFPWYAMAIFWNGTVQPCPRDFMGKMPVGSLKEQSILEIWNSAKMIQLRDDIIKHDFSRRPVCEKCDQPYKYQKVYWGIPFDYIPSYFKDSPIPYGIRRLISSFLNRS